MTTPSSTTASPQAPDSQVEPLQPLSVHDGEMLEQLVDGMRHHRMHVVLSSVAAAATEQRRAVLLQRLCESDVVQVDDASGRTTELLLQRFNALVAAMPMEQAMDRTGRPAGPITVFLLQASAPVPSAELRLLARLANDFPGANVRILLVLQTPVDVAAHVQALGRNVLHWAIRSAKTTPEPGSDGKQAPVEVPVAAKGGDSTATIPNEPRPAPVAEVPVPPAALAPAPGGRSRRAAWRGTASCLFVGVLGLSALAAATQTWPPRTQPAPRHQQPAVEMQRSPECGTSRSPGCSCALST